MPITLSAVEARRFRLLSQGLGVGGGDLGGAGPSVADIVERTGGVQAQDVSAAGLQIRARSFGLTVADLHRALFEERSIVRTWAMRGTLHLIPAEDQRWMTALLGPPSFSAGRGRRLQLGLDEATLNKAHKIAVESLTAEGPLTRQQLAERLAPHGIPVADQGLNHVVRSGGVLGIITHGPMLDGRTETFVAADSWLGGIERPELGREEALARLALRYVGAFGPATPRDFSAWAGLPLRDARAAWGAISDELVEVVVVGEQAWIHKDGMDSGFHRNEGSSTGGGAGKPIVRLLGFFDTYLLGYKGRDLAVAPEHTSRVNAGGGMIRPVVTIDGRAVATWSLARVSRGQVAEVSVQPFDGLEEELAAPGIGEALAREAADIGRFQGVEVALGEGPSP